MAPGATLEDALGGGDDYELVMAHSAVDALAGAFADQGLRPPVVIGWCVADQAHRTLHGEAVVARFEHPWG